jgi:hypothetical protein
MIRISQHCFDEGGFPALARAEKQNGFTFKKPFLQISL